LIAICFALFSLSNGFRVQRNDLENSNDTHTELKDNINIEDPHEDPQADIEENPEGEIHVDLQEDHEDEDSEVLLSESQVIVTESPPNEGVEGSPEDKVEGSPEDEVEGSPEDEVEGSPEDEVEGSPEHLVEGSPEDEVEGSPEDEVEGTPEDEVEGSPEITNPIDICDGSKTFVSNFRNCSLFYDCNSKKGSSCPHGMWFDPNYIDDILCQYPEVICAADNNICDCAEQYPPPPPDPLIENSVACLKDNRFHLIQSQVSCGRYFICHNEMKYRMECRQGLHYNEKTEMCDYPEVVNCRIPDPDCPAEGIKFLPDTTRCEVFYFCVHGFKTKQVCPFYHIWDIRSNSCRRQDEAICHLEL